MLGIGFGVTAVLLGIIWIVARRGLTPSQLNIRSHSFIWPTVEIMAGLVVLWMLGKGRHADRDTPGLIFARRREGGRVVTPPCDD